MLFAPPLISYEEYRARLKEKHMKVEVWLEKNNTNLVYEDAQAVYQKGDLVCIGYTDKVLGKTVDKYPVVNIFKIRETAYASSQPNKSYK